MQRDLREALQLARYLRADVNCRSEPRVEEGHREEVVVEAKALHEVGASLHRALCREVLIVEVAVEEDFEEHVPVVVFVVLADVCEALDWFVEFSFRRRQRDANLHQKRGQISKHDRPEAKRVRVVGQLAKAARDIGERLVNVEIKPSYDQFARRL